MQTNPNKAIGSHLKYWIKIDNSENIIFQTAKHEFKIFGLRSRRVKKFIFQTLIYNNLVFIVLNLGQFRSKRNSLIRHSICIFCIIVEF